MTFGQFLHVSLKNGGFLRLFSLIILICIFIADISLKGTAEKRIIKL